MGELRHPDWQEFWPQSGEVVPSSANYLIVRSQRPEALPRGAGAPGRLRRLLVGEAVIHYADGSRWLGITVFELRDRLIFRERVHFGPPFRHRNGAPNGSSARSQRSAQPRRPGLTIGCRGRDGALRGRP
jgi:hypothetical protein